MLSKRARVVTPFEEEVTCIVKTVLGNAESPQTITNVVQHLVSDDVGATCMEDLEALTLSMLPPTLGLKPIKAAKLLKYFTAPGPSSSAGGSAGTHSHAGSQVLQEQSQERIVSVPPTGNRSSGLRSNLSSATYSFTVPWNSLPKDTLDRLTYNEVNKVRAHQKDIDTLKLAIVKKLVSSYTDYKENHPGLQKTPGTLIYESITDQVFLKYKYTLADVVNGSEVGDGKAGFQRSVLICTENQMRPKDNPPNIPNAVRASGIVGVLEEQYMPNLDGTAREDQEKIREDLQIIYNEDSDTWFWDDIKENMLNSYELQRDDVAKAKVAIEQESNNQEKENEQSDSDEPPPPKALSELMNSWPFLFYVSALTWHHNRLTGRALQPHLDEFLEKHLEYTLNFLTSCSKSNKKNMALNLKLNKKIQNWTVPQKFLKALYMIANHFGEEKYLFIHSAERTTPAGEINTKGLADICIIAQDNEIFTAEKYFICADEVVLMKVSCSQEAITSLIQLAFVLDLNYPKMPLTFEFLERFVYGMGLSNTRVKNKKGKTLIVLTPSVRNTINELNAFEKEMQEDEP